MLLVVFFFISLIVWPNEPFKPEDFVSRPPSINSTTLSEQSESEADFIDDALEKQPLINEDPKNVQFDLPPKYPRLNFLY